MSFIKASTADSLLTLTISRPKAMNALNLELLAELKQVLQETIQNKAIKGILLTGDGEKAFVAGADIKELAGLTSEKALQLSQNGQELFKNIENCTIPVVAVVNGFALGGGCELAMACHMRIATENAKFGQPEVNLGIIPGYGGTQRLAQLTGRGKALELILTGDIISAQEAKNIGLVNHVVSTKTEAIELATKILGKISGKAPIAIAKSIQSINAGFISENDGYKTEAKEFASLVMTEDFKEGTSAFIEKRPAQFKGK
jgi:enoyl-CoA hydratase